MKISTLLLFLIFFSCSFAQDNSNETEKLAHSERNAARNLMQLAVNPNTLNYDVTYHKLEFSVDPAVYSVAGKVTTTFTALSNMTTVTFDLANELTVSTVKQGATNLIFSRSANNELIINLPAIQTAGTSASVEITYSGAPPVNGFNAFTTQTRSNGSKTLYTLSEPFGARDWWPCKQDLNDKIANIDVYITAPSQYVSVSNGLQQSAVINGATKTTWFKHNYPIPAYLICMAVTDYTIINQTAGIGGTTFPIVNYIYAENNTTTVQNQLAQTPLIINLFETLFEPYPFRNEKYGHAQFGWGGGMEHTTVSFMNNFNRNLIAHEMAHQWFGDKITCGTWKDIWLNESFAEYVSGLVVENFDGAASFINWKTGKINNITSVSNGNIYLTEAQSTNVNRIFDYRLTYNKGAMVLNMLRLKMGNTNFFQAIKNYLADPNLAYKYAITTDFKSKAEAVYGQSLTEFFNDWIYNEGYPSYTITSQNWGSGQVKITVSQTQSDATVSYFEMPLPIRLTGANGEVSDIIVNNVSNGQEFIVPVSFAVTGIAFDVNKDIISKNNTATALNTSAFVPDQALAIYPNPVSDEITIQKPNNVFLISNRVYNSIGQKVLENNQAVFSVAALSNGVYFLELETSEGTYHKKFIKK